MQPSSRSSTSSVSSISSVSAALTAPAKKPCGRRRHKHNPGDEALCKYASKACYKPRVVKKTGELHRYCDHHRQQANRNQRRLEQRRRLKDDATFSTPSSARSPTGSSAYSVNSYSSDGGASDDTEDSEAATLVGEALCSVIFEPYRQPVALRAEDLSSLRHIFADAAPPPTLDPTQGEQVWTCQL